MCSYIGIEQRLDFLWYDDDITPSLLGEHLPSAPPPPLSSFHIFDVGCSIHGAGDITLQILRSNSLQTRAEAEAVIGECPHANQRRGSRGSVNISPLSQTLEYLQLLRRNLDPTSQLSPDDGLT